jgi:predicted TIM-barrel fold metal-dependent hydrolase
MKTIDSAVRLHDDPKAVEAWLARAEECHIDHSIVAPTDACVAVFNDEGNRQMIRLAKAYPRTFSGLAVANPWYGAAAVDDLRRAFDEGLIGLYLHPMRQGFRLTESLLDPLMEVCVLYARPVYCYTGVPICSMPLQLSELARRFPTVPFVMGHGAYADFWYDLVPALTQAANILVETSCQVGGVLQAVIDGLGAGRAIFGSGYPRSDPMVEIGKMSRLRLSDEDRAKIMFANARALWRLQG